MEKCSITLPSRVKALNINRMIENRSQWDKEPVLDGYPLHAGINYTSDPLVYECAKKMMESMGNNFVRVEPMSKKFNLRNEFGKFRLCVGLDVFLAEPIDIPNVYTLYLGNKELVSIGFSDGWDNDREYTVFVNNPYYENGLHGFEKRKVKSRKQYIFLKTRSAKIAFNMVNRIVANMRYPKAKNIW